MRQQDVAASNSNLFDGVRSDKLRQFLHGSQDVLRPSGKSPADTAQLLSEQITAAGENVQRFREALPSELERSQQVARDLSLQVPKLVRDASANVTLAAKDVSVHGKVHESMKNKF